MSNILKITRMNFMEMFNVQIIICAGVLLLHLLISMAILALVDTKGPAGSGDLIALITLPILSIVFFIPSFKYAIAQGISRKTFFSAGSLTIVLAAAAMAILVAVFYLINLKLANVWMIYEMIYNSQNIPALIVWEFAALLFLGMFGWCLRLVYFRSSRPVKYIVSITPFLLAAFLMLFNALTDSGMGRAILSFLKAVMGLSVSTPNPYIGAASMMAGAVILGGVAFLLLRRAQIND